MLGGLPGWERWNEPLVGHLFGSLYYERGAHRREGKGMILASGFREVWLRAVRSLVLEGAAARFPDREAMVAVKEPHGSVGAPILLDALPESRLIFLVRDPRDAVASSLFASYIPREGPAARHEGRLRRAEERREEFVRRRADQYARDIERVGEAFAGHPGPKVLVRYEDLRRAPGSELARACAALGVPVATERIEGVVGRQAWERLGDEEVGKQSFRRRATPGGWKEDLTVEQAEIVESRAGSVLAAYYDEERAHEWRDPGGSEPTPAEPPPARRAPPPQTAGVSPPGLKRPRRAAEDVSTLRRRERRARSVLARAERDRARALRDLRRARRSRAWRLARAASAALARLPGSRADGTDPLEAVERRLARPLPAARKPVVLFVVHAGGGGTPHTNADLIGSLSSRFRCLLLVCDLGSWRLVDHDAPSPSGEEHRFEQAWDPARPLDQERQEAVRTLCREHGVVLAHVRSLMATGPELLSVLAGEGVRTVLSFHDFYTVCPTVQLLDESLRFCQGHCTPGEGACRTSRRWLPGLPPLKHRYVYEWRTRMGKHLPGCEAYVTSSPEARSLIAEHFPFLRQRPFEVIAHGRDLDGFRDVATRPSGRPVRVACLAAQSPPKGLSLIRDLMELDRAAGPAFEFHFFGREARGVDLEELGGVVHGPYARAELPDRLAALRPSFALIPSFWAETWCHTLTEAWMAGLPVFASSMGALRERIEGAGGGWLLDHTDADGWYAAMRAALEEPATWDRRRAEIAAMEPRTIDDMAGDYRAVYERVLAADRAEA